MTPLTCLPKLDVQGASATLTLDRASQRNALRESDLVELLRLFGEINANSDVQVVLIRANTDGQSKPVFCAGYSLDDFDSPEDEAARFGQVADALASLRPITIAVLNGSVYGGATDLALACDLRFALAGTQWRMPACALGLHFYAGGLQRYVNHLGMSRAKQAFLLGRAMPVGWLAGAGVFAAVCETEAVLQTEVEAAVRDLLVMSPLALQLTKRSLCEIAQGAMDRDAIRVREQVCVDGEDFARTKATAKAHRAGRSSR